MEDVGIYIYIAACLVHVDCTSLVCVYTYVRKNVEDVACLVYFFFRLHKFYVYECICMYVCINMKDEMTYGLSTVSRID